MFGTSLVSLNYSSECVFLLGNLAQAMAAASAEFPAQLASRDAMLQDVGWQEPQFQRG